MKQWRPYLCIQQTCAKVVRWTRRTITTCGDAPRQSKSKKGAWAVAIKNLTVREQRAHSRAVKKWEARVKEAHDAGKKYAAAASPFKTALDRLVCGKLEKSLKEQILSAVIGDTQERQTREKEKKYGQPQIYTKGSHR